MFSHQVLNVFPNMFPIDHHNFCPKFNNLYSKALLSSCFGSGSSYWGWCCLNFKVSNSLSINLGCTSQLLEMPFTHQMQSSRHKFVGGIERKLCCFLPGYDHALHIQFIRLKIRQKLNPAIEQRERKTRTPTTKLKTKFTNL